MRGPLLLLLVALTSLGALLLGTRWRGRAVAGLARAGRGVLECAGLTLIFLAANLAVGGAGVLALRVLTGQFVSFYVLNDATLLGLSTLQAIAWAWWRTPRD